jgi:dihydrofolate reductase
MASKVKLHISMSLDGYVAGPDQGPEDPLGKGGLALHDWVGPTHTFLAMQGDEGGERGIDDDHFAEANANVGAYIMGRNMFGPIRGPWGTEDWKGWWGSSPPYHAPVFVLTSHERELIEMDGGTTFHFVTDGIESALTRAQDAAADRDVLIAGGARVAQQYLRAGLVDEMQIHVVPVLLGSGERLFDDFDGSAMGWESVSVVSSPAVAHFSFVRASAP